MMGTRRKTAAGADPPPRRAQSDATVRPTNGHAVLPPRYLEACRLAERGRHDDARKLYSQLARRVSKKNVRLHALIRNDLAVLDALEGRLDEARVGWHQAVEADGELLAARLNRDLLEAEAAMADAEEGLDGLKLVPAPGNGQLIPSFQLPATTRHLADGTSQGLTRSPPQPFTIGGEGAYSAGGAGLLGSARVSDPAVRVTAGFHDPNQRGSHRPIRVAILSLLFNWPSTGGGNMHTAGLLEFLSRAGYEVRHFFARYPAWGIGRVTEDGLVASTALEFDEAAWNVAEIQARYRGAVDEYQPDYVAITDAWNMKPHLAGAISGYPVFLLFQAQECLCPLNNLRLLGIGPNQLEQCPRNQLATPKVCHECLAQRGHHSGALHRVERALAGVGTTEYDQRLRRSLLESEAVLVLNPLTAAVLEPYARRVCVVPWGIDAARFPWPAGDRGTARSGILSEGGVGRPTPNEEPNKGQPTRLFMAAVAGEIIKGFHVAHEACRLLWQSRHDFELVVTFDPPGQIDEFTRAVGWQSQADLPAQYSASDICLVPTIAQDGLSITSVEAMAAGIPLIASRIGGVPYTVTDGVTGLLCEPGDPADLAAKIARLLDDPALRHEMGLAGRRRFDADFTWETVIERYWRPLLAARRAVPSST
jgi:glycosyltransferase involved in cell wall biosynthesis